MIGNQPGYQQAPREYGYALDAAMPALAAAGVVSIAVRCDAPELQADLANRIPCPCDEDVVDAALWLEPDGRDWLTGLAALAGRLRPGGRMVIVASRPQARLLPERRSWQGKALGLQLGGLGRLRRGLRQNGLVIDAEYGMHGPASIFAGRASILFAHFGRPDLADRWRAAGDLHYCSTGLGFGLSTVAWILAHRGQSNG